MKFEDKVGLGRIVGQRAITGGFEGCKEFRVGAIRIAGKWFGIQTAIGADIRYKDGFRLGKCRRDRAA